MELKKAVRARIPAIVKRDSRLREQSGTIRRLTARLETAEAELTKATEKVEGSARFDPRGEFPASFLRNLVDLRRTVALSREADPKHRLPVLNQTRKLRNYQFAMSHGLPIPTVLRVWPTVEDIDLAGLPDQFVVKSDGGAGGHGVVPLVRLDEDRYRLLGGDKEFTRADVVTRLSTNPTLRGPYFVEEALVQPSGGPIPDDIRLYAFYGEIAHVFVRRMDGHQNLRSARYRFYDGDGTPFNHDIIRGIKMDPTLEIPGDIEQMLAIARHASRAIGMPFMRVDLYGTDRGPFLGELTRAPGGNQVYEPDHDERMGRAWDFAEQRLLTDVIDGRPLRVLYGEHPSRNFYPEGSRAGDPNIIAKFAVAPCAQWCGS